jgi:hypothetical protein
MFAFIALAFGLCAAMSADGMKVNIGYRVGDACQVQHEWEDHTYGYLGERRAFVELIDGGATIAIEDLEFTIMAFGEA